MQQYLVRSSRCSESAACCRKEPQWVDPTEEVESFEFYDAFYFVIISISTVGYGEITPIRWLGMLLTMVSGRGNTVSLGVALIDWSLVEGGDHCAADNCAQGNRPHQ